MTIISWQHRSCCSDDSSAVCDTLLNQAKGAPSRYGTPPAADRVHLTMAILLEHCFATLLVELIGRLRLLLRLRDRRPNERQAGGMKKRKHANKKRQRH